MKKDMVSFLLMSILFVLVLGLKSTVNANTINSINMDIYVDNNGNAEVTEVWNCSTSQGTECYHPYYNLGNSQITNLRVYDQTNAYTSTGTWNTNASMSGKAYKCGINKISNGVELCWGISKYGANVYTVKYNISNFVSELTDCQMMYWTLIPDNFSNKIGSVIVKIHSDKYFQDTIDVWGYGQYGSLCYVSEGAIHMRTEKSLAKEEYITFLAKFPKETFNTSNVLNYDFNHYFEMAQKGAKSYNKILENIKAFIAGMIRFLPFILAIVVGAFSSTKKFGFKYGEDGKKIPKDVAYYRDIPCNGDIFKAYYIAYQYGITKNKTDILGAIILKWLKQGLIRTEQRDGGKIFKKEETVIILKDDTLEGNEVRTKVKAHFADKVPNQKERELLVMMYEASKDGILENKEFEKWCQKSYKEILDWFDDILREQRVALISDGLITGDSKGVIGSRYTATHELKEEALKIAGLKRFLLEYTLIQDRYAIEVELFEDYLIYAQLLGIAKQVSKQFKEIYPDMIEQTNYGSYDNVVYIHHVSSSGVSSANSAKAAANSYSSGGGGFSSGGGGGGSFGGGGGGRRLPLKNL